MRHFFSRSHAVAMAALLASSICLAQTQPADEPATGEAARLKAINTIENYYAELYSKSFKTESNARLAQLVSIVSLSRIDGPSLTQKLLVPTSAKLAKQDPVVAQVAWEALAARAKSLTPAQRKEWLASGLAATEFGAFPGPTAGSLLTALASGPIEAKQLPVLSKLVVRLIDENDPQTPDGKAALDAGAAAIAAWGSRDVTNVVIKEFGTNTVRNARVAALLAALSGAPAEPTPAAWGKWLSSAKWSPTPIELSEGSVFFPRPEKIVNPADTKWIKESEIGDLRVTKLDLVFCVDGTGSMQASNEFVTAYVQSVYLALSAITQSTRTGAIYYRHENNPAVMLDCCHKAVKNKDMTVQPIPLTTSPVELVKSMRAMLPKEGTRISGHGRNGAYFGALEGAVKLLGLPRKNTSLVIVCIGDARMTPGSETEIVELAKLLKEKGYITIFLNRDPWNAENLSAASMAASGEKPVVYRDDVKKLKQGGDVYADFEESAFGEMARRAIKASLPAEYADRATPVFSSVWKILVAKEHARDAKVALRQSAGNTAAKSDNDKSPQ